MLHKRGSNLNMLVVVIIVIFFNQVPRLIQKKEENVEKLKTTMMTKKVNN